MELSIFSIFKLIIFGSWMAFFPKHLVNVYTKFQLFLFKYFPPSRLVFKSEEEAKESIFNEGAVRAIGFAFYLGAIVMATKMEW
jgi:hypothetical protein